MGGTRGTPKAPPSDMVQRARRILRGERAESGALLVLSKGLKGEQEFSLARRVLALAVAEWKATQGKETRDSIRTELALCTYKDTDLPLEQRLETAFSLLEEFDLESSERQEVLGLAGAIHKRQWEFNGQRACLERSLEFYRRGYAKGPKLDEGYTAINAAFIHDLLAADTAGSKDAAHLGQHRAEARRIREDVLEALEVVVDPPGVDVSTWSFWKCATIAEALFGLGEYERAGRWLEARLHAGEAVPPWEQQSTIQQLARLVLLTNPEITLGELRASPAWKALSAFDQGEGALWSTFIGKVGLALSGGGFRAAFYHIGVLARLAELDVLRHVEVLSCVSGGSIIGAHYYLEVRKLLATTPVPSRQDYITLVGRVTEDFLRGVQRNLRMRVLANPWRNIKMIFSPDDSRTVCLGDLYESEIFSRVLDGEGDVPRELDQLNIRPHGTGNDFRPKRDNWKRAAKAPVLILNATTLNTGHSWQFTTSWMGEPPGRIDTQVDVNEQLRRLYHEEAPPAVPPVRLGAAVAASSCVPGLFPPITLRALYPNRVVRLVDGGVCDNQGVYGLLEQDCNVVLVSDGSGQSESQRDPSSGVLGVPLRANTILQSRVRDSQYQELKARHRAGVVRRLMFLHLKQDLIPEPVDWEGCLEPWRDAPDQRTTPAGPLTSYGVSREVQQRVAAVRTDLDAFNDAEAHALMYSGYAMARRAFEATPSLAAMVAEKAEDVRWPFDWIRSRMADRPEETARLLPLLDAAQYIPFKAWRLSRPLSTATWVLAVGALVAALWWVILVPHEPWQLEVTVLGVAGSIAATLVGLATVHLLGKRFAGLLRLRETAYEAGARLGMGVLGAVVAWLQTSLFDRIYLRRGARPPGE